MVVQGESEVNDVAISNLVRHRGLAPRKQQQRQRETPAYRKCLPLDHASLARVRQKAAGHGNPYAVLDARRLLFVSGKHARKRPSTNLEKNTGNCGKTRE